MKGKVSKIILPLIGLVIGSSLYTASVQAQTWQVKEIHTLNISVSEGVTSSLIFPFAVISADRGLPTLLIQKPKGMNNVLHLKAASEHMKTTSLSVITSDGKLYPFMVSYSVQPSFLNLSIGSDTVHENGPVSFSEGVNNEAEIMKIAARIAAEKKNMCNIHNSKFGITLAVKGVYVKHDVIYFKVALKNTSPISYDTELFRFCIVDNVRGKKTSTQEVQLKPHVTSGNYSHIKNDSTNTVVFALPKFLIPDQKHLVIEMIESGGGRNPRIIINNRRLVKAKAL